MKFFDVDISKYIWALKYKHVNDDTIEDTFTRVAKSIAKDDKYLFEQFYKVMIQGRWMPGGRILAGAGTDNKVTLLNCYVMNTIPDSMSGIGEVLKESMLTMQQGGGIGMDFSTIRPEGARLKSLGPNTWASGPISFMYMWDSMCQTIMSAGSRRGAMMGTLRCDHPDIIKFIKAKHKKGVLTNFNVSVLVTDEFMEAVREDKDWYLTFHEPPHPMFKNKDLPEMHNGKYVYNRVKARELWDLITKSTYEYSEPGVIFIDRINKNNNLNYIETISCTNPCGEQPLPPYGACNLGAVNLAAHVKNPFAKAAEFDFELLKDTVRIGINFLDNVLDVANYPLPQQVEEAQNKRRIGLGISGLHDAMLMLGIAYGDNKECLDFVEKVMNAIARNAYEESIVLAKRKGPFPLFDAERFNYTFAQKLGDDIVEKIRKHGIRNGVLLTVAPTGTTSLVFGNISSGCEPVFSYRYIRNVRRHDNETEKIVVEDFAYGLYKKMFGDEEELPPYFVEAHTLTVEDHIAVQAATQKWVDASISKTINCPEDISFEAFQNVYWKAYELGCKGCTTYRPSEVRGAVLERLDDKKKEQQKEAAVKKIVKRPDTLEGKTYKIKWPSVNEAFYITINDLNGKPYEMFIHCKSSRFSEWTTALSRMISAIMRTADDISFVWEELQQIRSSYDSAFVEGRFLGSLVAYIGVVLENHVRTRNKVQKKEENIETENDEGQVKIEYYANADFCPQCNQKTFIMAEGCKKCTNCFYSKCG